MPRARASLAARLSMNLVTDDRSSPAICSITALNSGSTRIWITVDPPFFGVDNCSTLPLNVLHFAALFNRAADCSAAPAHVNQGAF